MVDIDDFIRPNEWVPDVMTDMGNVIRKWGEDRYFPVRQQVDEDWQEHKIIKPLLKELLVDLGLGAALLPADVGGSDLPDPVSFLCVLGEEIGRIDSGFCMACLASMWAILPICLPPFRNEELIKAFGPKFSSRELYLGCFAMTEPASGADVENYGQMKGRTIQTTATLEGERWVINGHKLWPSNSNADLYCVVCTTNRGSTDLNDVALIMVPADTKGITVGNPYHKAGMAADMNCDIWFDDVRVPANFRVHGPGEDFKCWRRNLTIGSMMSAAMSLGVMKAVYEIIKKWTTERMIAGKPLKEHSMVAEMLCDIAMCIESTSAWMWAYAREIDRTDLYRKWEPSDERFALKTRGLALFASNAVEKACNRAMDFMGSYGYSREFDIEKHWRDQKVIGLWLGGKGLKTLENARYWYDLETL